MSAGTYISVLGHVGFIGWALSGMSFDVPPVPEAQVTDVSVISTEMFDIMLNNTPPDIGVVDAAAQPNIVFETPVVTSETDPPPNQADVSETDPPDDDPLPTARPTRLVRPDAAALQSPLVPIAPPVEVAPSSPLDTSARPQPRPAPRVAPTAAPPPPPGLDIGNINRDATTPSDEPADTPIPEEDAQAPEEATTEIVTEAEAGSGAPLTSLRPQLRPRDVAAAPEDPAQEDPGQDTDFVTAALEEALAAAAANDTAAAAETPTATLSAGQVQGLQFAIQQCWNVGSLSSDALATTVIVGFEMTQDARPVPSSLRLVSRQGGTDAGARQAFEAARRAILRCGAAGFGLPADLYEQWRSIEMTFNPERMRIK